MNRIAMLGIVALVGSFAAAADKPAGKKSDPGPCAQIQRACKAAGFVKGGAKKGNGLYKDCFANVMAGKPVKGVDVDASTVQACQKKRAQRKSKKA